MPLRFNLHQVTLAGALMLAASACGLGGGGTESPDGPPDPHATTGHLGTVSYSYDPAVLKAANVRIAVPPRKEAVIYGVKLLPSRGIGGVPALCPEGEETCSLEEQPGLTLALLERPYATYEEALRASELEDGIRPADVAGAEGIAFRLVQENGPVAEYRLVPVAGRALLIMLQLDGENAAEERALAQVIASIDLEG